MGKSPYRRASSVHIVLALVVMLTMSACGGSSNKPTPSKNTLPTASASPTPQAVTVSGVSSSTKVTVTGTAPGIDPGTKLTFVSPVYTLSPSGPLGGRATVTMQLDNALPPRTTVLAATRQSPADNWAYAPATLASDGQHVTFTTTHLSDVGAVSMDLSGAYAAFKDQVRTGLVTAINRTIAKPTCAAMPDARKDGYSAASWKRKTLAWCFGLENNKRVLKVVNRRLTPIQVAHAPAPLITGNGGTRGLWITWAGVLTPGSQDTFLAPGGTATYDADLDPDKLLLVSAESDAVAQSLRALQNVVRAIVTQLGQFGVTGQKYDEVFKSLVARPQCANALGKGSDALVVGCLSKQKMVKTFGADAVLLTPLVSIPGLKVFLGKQFKTLALQDQQEITQHIVVHRKKPDFTGLVGFWAGPDHRVLSVSKDGVVTEHYATVDGRIVDLTYQLSAPQTANGATTAQAVVTSVTVYNRKAINGNVPHKGDTGTITVKNGVVSPPFLSTSYCDKPSLKAGKCGKPAKPAKTTKH